MEPIWIPSRRIPYSLQKGVEAALQESVKDGILERVEDSKWSSPIITVVKPDGTIRTTGDFSRLNRHLEIPHANYPTQQKLFQVADVGLTELMFLFLV